MRTGRRGAAAARVAAMAMTMAMTMAMLAGCGGGDAAPAPSTSSARATAAPAASAPDGPPPVTPTAAAELTAALDAALASGDGCAVFGVIRSAIPDLGEPGGVRRFYDDVADHLADSTPLAPAAVRDDWRMLAALARREGKAGGGGAAFDSTDVRAALDRIDRACPPGAS